MFKGGCSSFPFFVLGRNQNKDVLYLVLYSSKESVQTIAVSSDEARKIIQQLLGLTMALVFDNFDSRAMAFRASTYIHRRGRDDCFRCPGLIE